MVTALYDGNCVICQTTRRFVNALDWRKQVEFLDLHAHDTVSHRYPQFDQAAMMGEIHVVADDRLYAGFAGTRRLLKELPLMLPVWALLHLPGMMTVGKFVYRHIANNRYAVNKLFGVELTNCTDGACKIPQ